MNQNNQNRNHCLTVSATIAREMNANRLAFKTYSLAELDTLINEVTKSGLKVSTEEIPPEELEDALQEQGFVVFPEIFDAIDGDGQVRVYRAGSIVGNLLQAIRHPGMRTDTALANFLIQLSKRRETNYDNQADEVEANA